MSDTSPLGPDPFLVQIDDFITRARDRADAIVRATAEEALARVKQLTPVDTGYLRANWCIVRGTDAVPLSGDREQLSIQAVLQLKAGDTWSLINPTVYAARIEFGFVGEDKLGRHYDQGGAHMMQQTITEMPQLVARAIERVERGGASTASGDGP